VQDLDTVSIFYRDALKVQLSHQQSGAEQTYDGTVAPAGVSKSPDDDVSRVIPLNLFVSFRIAGDCALGGRFKKN
jgi:hypothetical protein